METLLRGEKPAEVIPFSLDVPVLYYPVRHHSPACAWHLERVMERYAPPNASWWRVRKTPTT